MTNKQYHRKVRALARTSERKASVALDMEIATLHGRISEYRNGGLRCVNGKGNTRHRSKAAA